MLPSYKVLILFLALIPSFLQFSDLAQNRELQKDTNRLYHFNHPLQATTSLNSSDFHLNTLFIDEGNNSLEEEEQRSARNRIGSTAIKRCRRIEEQSSTTFCIYNKSDTGDITPHQLHLRL